MGIVIPTDFHIFQRDWNHQPVFNNEKSRYKNSPPKTLDPHLNIENNDTMVAMMAGDVPASSSVRRWLPLAQRKTWDIIGSRENFRLNHVKPTYIMGKHMVSGEVFPKKTNAVDWTSKKLVQWIDE